MRLIVNWLIFGIGVFCIYDGIYRGTMYASLEGIKPDQLVVSSLTNPGGNVIFPHYTACGVVRSTGQFAMVAIFQDQFRRMEPGSTLDIYPIQSSGNTIWVNGAKLEESKPILNIFGFHFSWHLPVGLLLAGYGGICLLESYDVLKRQKPRRLH